LVSLNELGEYVSPKTKAYVVRQFGQTQRPFFKGELSIEAMSYALLPVAGGVGGNALPAKPPTPNVAPTPNMADASRGNNFVSNSIGMKLRTIPPGEFLMGAPDADDSASADEKPQHRVQITRPFAIGVYEVTVGQYRQFVNATAHQTTVERLGLSAGGWVGGANPMGTKSTFNWRNWWPNQSDEHPVINITWEDAVAFCDWLSRVEGKRYRLPTEAEWEYACRAGSTTRFPRGDDENVLDGVENIADASAKQFNLGGTYASWDDQNAMTARVGSFQPNAWGLYDMNGNTRELCSDWYSTGYYATSPTADPQGPPQGESHAVRGGGWLSHPLQCRSSRRFHMVPPMVVNTNVGFRVVRE
jgi:formylglycine-generating enzyme required for sulfatase activity